MKKLVSFIAVLAMTSLAVAQTQLERTVTVDVTGNRTKRIAVDGNYHTITNLTTTEQQSILINGLQNGQHTLELFRGNQAIETRSYQTTFTLREGYDMTISISSTGAVSMSESRTSSNQGDGRSAISAQAFNRIFIATKNRTSSISRAAYLENQFGSNKRFTSKQASQLIQLINSESLRLKLAKQAYDNVTDRTNFSLVSSLLKSNNSKLELNNYIASNPEDDIDDDDDVNAYVPMSQEKFDAIYREVSAETTLADRNYYLSNFFAGDHHYYTSLQAKQLIQLVNSEGERYNLAKLAYRAVTDRENYGEVVALLNLPTNRTTLRNYIASYDNTNGRPAMSATAFGQLYQSIYNHSLSSARYSALNTAFTTAGNYFTATQARQLIQLVSNESNRLALSKLAYKVLVDRANYTQLSDLLTSQASRNDLNAYVQNYDNYNNNNGYGVAMTDSEFNTLYNNINNSWSSSSRLSAASTAFNNTSNYFTTAQVRRVLLLINSESDRLTLAKAAYDNVVDQASYSQLYDVFNTTDRRTELARYIADAQNGGVGTRIAMSDSEFNTLYNNINNSWSSSSRLSSANIAFNNTSNYFTTAQVRRVLLLINSEADRLTLAKAAYDNVVDQASYSELYDVFNTTDRRTELARYIADIQNGGAGTRIAMSDSEFQSLVKDVQMTFGFGAKMGRLSGIFNTETNYFTVQQVRQLIQLVSAENNRLELAKSAYNNVTDPTNFTQLYDIFTSQTSKDELSAYISNAAIIN